MAGKKKKVISENYLEFIPVHNEMIKFQVNEAGEVIIFQENKGLFNKIAQVLFKKPKVSSIHLDKMGNFIWPLMDGKKNVLDIAKLVKEKFGDEAEPLYERLALYIKTLENYGFVKVIQA
ncbi:MAG: PqqD family protein [Agathobacter sp.]|nr:PqqD family protein [Agathobacter sp.]